MILQRGDTIIEVTFAITIFALVSVLAINSMQQGSAIAQRSLEIELVRQEMDTQADALRYIHSAYLSDTSITDLNVPLLSLEKDRWKTISIDRQTRTAYPYNDIVDNNQRCRNLPNTVFAIDVSRLSRRDPRASSVGVNNTQTYSKLDGTIAKGLWIEAVRPLNTDKFYDFHIRACWYPPGQSEPIVLGNIVRLYDPAL